MNDAYKMPPLRRRRLGRRLRALRENAGLNLDKAAARLDKTRSSLHRIEAGETRADVHLIRSMMDLYDEWDEDLLDETREALKPMWFNVLGAGSGYLDLETLCCRVCEFSPQVVPGLLQTEAYTRAIFTASAVRHSPSEIDLAVTVRRTRQRRLTSEDDAIELVTVVDEAALRREVGGPKVMREQLQHMLEAAALPSVTLQVLPLSRGTHCAMDGGFVLLEYRDPSDPELLFIEHITGAVLISDAEKVRDVRLQCDQLRTEALTPSDSLEFLESLAGEFGRADELPHHLFPPRWTSLSLGRTSTM